MRDLSFRLKDSGDQPGKLISRKRLTDKQQAKMLLSESFKWTADKNQESSNIFSDDDKKS